MKVCPKKQKRLLKQLKADGSMLPTNLHCGLNETVCRAYKLRVVRIGVWQQWPAIVSLLTSVGSLQSMSMQKVMEAELAQWHQA